MSKIFLQEYSSESFNAGSKARNDCDKILESMGYSPYYLKISNIKLLMILQLIYYLVVLPIKISFYNECFIQYPFYSIPKSLRLWFYKIILRHYKGDLTCLLHDCIGLRDGTIIIEPELKLIISHCSNVIVHTPKMKSIIEQSIQLPLEKIKVLYLFDYLTDANPIPSDIEKKEIIFAGNLDKSHFLKDLHKLPQSLSFNVYGTRSSNLKETSRCVYKGRFSPDDISTIEGSWGLVWDGDQLETCHNNYGNYLRINSSHKISLYLVSCRPVIIWEESSLRDFILNNHLGIAVKSLYEIDEKINDLSVEEKRMIVDNVRQCSLKLRRGEFLKQCLKK